MFAEIFSIELEERKQHINFLVKTGNKLADQIETEPFSSVLEAMDLHVGPREALRSKDVALLMFKELPEQFFHTYTQVDIIFLKESGFFYSSLTLFGQNGYVLVAVGQIVTSYLAKHNKTFFLYLMLL